MGFTRYQIALKNALKLKPTAYRFQFTNSLLRVCDYMKRCIVDEVMFDSSNINYNILDSALIRLTKEINEHSPIAIVTASESNARILSITWGFKKIYSVNAVPDTASSVICYWDLDRNKIPSHLHVILTILRGE